jgi:hypothetical protein
MSDKIESILRSLAPLILIVVVSWLFSLFSSKLKKPTDQTGEEAKPETGKQLMDIFFQQEEVKPGGRPGELRDPAPVPPPESGWRTRPPEPGGPSVTPKPIKPRWWGA